MCTSKLTVDALTRHTCFCIQYGLTVCEMTSDYFGWVLSSVLTVSVTVNAKAVAVSTFIKNLTRSNLSVSYVTWISFHCMADGRERSCASL